MGLCGYFCEWASEIKAWKFVPQHLAPRVTCEQFLHGHTCEFEIWWQLWIVGFCNFPTSSTISYSPKFLALNAGLFTMSCHLQLSRLPTKGLPWLILLLFLLGSKNREIEAERKSIFFFFLFSAKSERVTPNSTKVEREWLRFLAK